MPTLDTALTRMIGIRYPIFSVGFGQSAIPDLAAAVSNAGGCGVIGASGAEPDEIRRRIVASRQLTDRPFAVKVSRCARRRVPSLVALRRTNSLPMVGMPQGVAKCPLNAALGPIDGSSLVRTPHPVAGNGS